MNRIEAFLSTFFQDVRYAVRTLFRNRLLSFAIIITLALGIGVNTAVFAILDTAILQLLPVADPERLCVLGSRTTMSTIQADHPGDRSGSFLSYPLYRDFQSQNEVFSDMAAISSTPVNAYIGADKASAGGSVEKAEARLVSGNFFSVLGVRAFLGRMLEPGDDMSPGAHQVVVISHGYWSRRFGRDPAIVGRTIRMNGLEYTVIGVADPQFSSVTPGLPTDLWVPTMMQAQLMHVQPFLSDRNILWLRVIGRLKPGVLISQASAASDTMFHRLLREEAGSGISGQLEQAFSRLRMDLVPFGRGFGMVREGLARPLFLLQGAVGLVLIIACFNVGSLLLARASGRRHEMTIRLALGASRVRLLRQLLTESLLLAFAGGLAALLLASWTTDVLWALFSTRSLNIEWSARMLVFTVLVCGLSSILFGLAPALRSTRTLRDGNLRDPGAVPTARQDGIRLRKMLVMSQMAVSLILLIMAGLFFRSLQNLRNEETGMSAEEVLVVEMDPLGAGYKKSELPLLYRELMERVESISGVFSASLSHFGPFSGVRRNNEVQIHSYVSQSDEDMRIQDTLVTPGYFKTMGIPILMGRGFRTEDDERSPKVAIVNEAFARHFFGDEPAVGRRFGIQGQWSGEDIEIIGIAGDVKYNELRTQAPRFAYYPASQQTEYLNSLQVRTLQRPESIAPLVRATIAGVAKDLPILEVTTMRAQIEQSFHSDFITSRLMGFTSFLALLLASLGVYGVMAYGVALRTGEIGVRLALGATRNQVSWMVLRETLVILAFGIAIGIPVSLGIAQLASSMLFGLEPMDPFTILASTTFLCLVGVLAGYLPARRAALLDPARALRCE